MHSSLCSSLSLNTCTAIYQPAANTAIQYLVLRFRYPTHSCRARRGFTDGYVFARCARPFAALPINRRKVVRARHFHALSFTAFIAHVKSSTRCYAFDRFTWDRFYKREHDRCLSIGPCSLLIWLGLGNQDRVQNLLPLHSMIARKSTKQR